MGSGSSFGAVPTRSIWVRVALVSFVVMVLALEVHPAHAVVTWCRTDPVVVLEDQIADIFVSGPIDAPLLVTGPNQVVVTVPPGVQAALLVADAGFGRGTDVAFEEANWLRRRPDRIEIQVDVFVPATDDAMPVRVEFAPRIVGVLSPASAEGTANAWVSLRTAL
jgi:hypothetical protein